MENNFNMCVCCVFDKVNAEFGYPFVQVNEASAIRSFQDAMNKDNTLHPEDMQLAKIAEWSPKSGKLTYVTSPKVLAEGRDIVYTDGE